MSALSPGAEIPAGTLVVVARGRQGEQLALTYTPCYGPGRWPFVRRWMGDRWTKREAKARVLRVATPSDVAQLAPGSETGVLQGPLPAPPTAAGRTF